MAESIRMTKKPVKFKYNVLSRARSKIRLLQVSPQDSDSDMKCCLKTYSRPDKCPPYTALSYTWGHDDKTHKIEMNEQEYYVNDNVWKLLHELRSTNQSKLFWIDAVCINQRADYEKSWQVASMGSIYVGAEQVIAWLGPESEDSGLAMDYVANTTVLGNQPISRLEKVLPPSPAQTAALLKLFSKPYWTRIWIVQEILLARDITVICGAKCLGWSLISRALASINQKKTEGISLLDGTSQETPGEVLFAEKEYWDAHASRTQGLPLKFLLDTYGHMDATIPIDKVYGILGLSVSHKLLSLRNAKTEASKFKNEIYEKIAFHISYFKRPAHIFVDVLRSVLLFHIYQKDNLAYNEFLDFGIYLATILEVQLDTGFIKKLYGNPFS
jgi:hypothetical protein